MTGLNLRTRARAFLRKLHTYTQPMDEAPEPARPVVHEDGGWTHNGVTVHADDAYAWRPDRGQHDAAKRELRIALWRFVHDPSSPVVDLAAVGLTKDSVIQQMGPLFPVPPDLAAACQRLGFLRLARAACPSMLNIEATAESFWTEHEIAVAVEAARRFAVNTATGQNPDLWHPGRGPFIFDSKETTISMLTLGMLHGPALTAERKLEPLTPYV